MSCVTTVYHKKYAHGFVVLYSVVVMQSFIMNSHEVFIHIHQGCFAGTGAIVRLPHCQRSKPDGYGKISQCITTTEHSKAKTVCIFLGIYCTSTFPSLQYIQENGTAFFTKRCFSAWHVLKFVTLSQIIYWEISYCNYEMQDYALRIWLKPSALNLKLLASQVALRLGVYPKGGHNIYVCIPNIPNYCDCGCFAFPRAIQIWASNRSWMCPCVIMHIHAFCKSFYIFESFTVGCSSYSYHVCVNNNVSGCLYVFCGLSI